MYDILKKFSRQVSLERFKSHSNNNAVEIMEYNKDCDKLDNQWSCGILWGNDDVKGLIVLKFTTLNVLAMGSTIFENTNDEMLFTYTKDFMKEYCNLYAGFIKGTFNNKGISVGISLPILSDNFSMDACLGYKSEEAELDQWKLNSNDSYFIVQSFVKIEDNFKKYDLNFLLESSKEAKESKSKSSIEFF